MTVADWIAEFLNSSNIDTVFTLPGGMITRILDAMARRGSPKIISMRHEQGAGFAAEGWARMTGKPGCAMATSGPGATNLLTPIASCYFDSTPALFLTGQVPRNEMSHGPGKNAALAPRQLGFQETNICDMAEPVTKWCDLAASASSVRSTLRFCAEFTRRGRPGPALIDIPMDVQNEHVPPGPDEDTLEFASLSFLAEMDSVGEATAPDPKTISAILKDLRDARRPLVLVGGGAAGAGVRGRIKALLERLWVPVVHSLLAKDLLNSDHPLNVGFIGSYGNRWANFALSRCDTLLVLGSRLDIRQTGAGVKRFVEGKRIYHVDVDPNETRVPAIRVPSHLSAFAEAIELGGLASPVNALKNPHLQDWFSEIAERKRTSPDDSEQTPRLVHPNRLMRAIGDASKDRAAAYVVDTGQHQMWAAQSLPIWNQRFLTSGGLGAMGFALPAAIGASLSGEWWSPKTPLPIVVIAGDGGFQLNLPELQTVRELNLPIKMIVLNNQGHGMVRQFQDQYLGKRRTATEPNPPGFTQIARAYGIESRWCVAESDFEAAMKWLWMNPDQAALLEVAIDPSAEALPKMAFGKGLDEMLPERK